MASVLQLVGLIRWAFVVPSLAAVYSAPGATEPARVAATTVFVALNQYAGVALGEHLGQLFTALWMALLGAEISCSNRYPRWLGWFSYFGAMLWIVGLAEGFATVLPLAVGPLGLIAPLAFLFMGVWMMALGVFIWRR